MSWPVFGTATLPTGASVAFSRDKRGLLDGLWHGDPAHRCLSGILAWQRGLLADLRHGDPAHKYLRAIPTWRRGLLTGFRDGTPATGTSEPSPQGHCYLVNRIVAEMGFVKFT